KMAENLQDEKKGENKTPEQLAKCFPIMSKFISPHLLSLLTYFNSDLDGFNYCDHNCRIEKCEHGEKIGKCKHKCQKCKHKKEPGNCNECDENKECEHEKIYTISQKDYDFAHMVWQETECKTFGDYHDIYLKTDVLILADAFEAFCKASYSAFKLDPANYLTAPGDMHDFFTAMKRRGMSLARCHIARANIPGLEGYDGKKSKKWLLYLDANNLYGWAMSQYLPTEGFKWLLTKPLEATSPLMQKILLLKEKSNRGCCLEQKEWIGKQRPDTEKLILTLHDKDHYVIHYRNLQQCIREGYVLEKVYRVLGFEQSPWMESYIAMNTQRHAKAKNVFEKDFWKLMNNSVFGKTMEDVGEEHRLRRLISDPAFVSRKIFYGANLVAVHRRQTNVKLNKPEYVGACILDLSKYFMYDFWYGHLKKKYGDRVRLLYTDTDSLIIEIETENIYQDMIDDCDLFDFSDYPEDYWVLKNLPEDQWIINDEGKWKDENGGDQAIAYVGVRAKCYSVVCENSRKNMIKAKGLKKSLIKRELTHKIFEDCALEGKKDQPRTAQFLRSYGHRMYRIKQTKRSINPLDTKLWIDQDGITTYLYGDCEIPEEYI
ncbi:699_t:CDS:2, partial [Cetraspora pellucida]